MPGAPTAKEHLSARIHRGIVNTISVAVIGLSPCDPCWGRNRAIARQFHPIVLVTDAAVYVEGATLIFRAAAACSGT